MTVELGFKDYGPVARMLSTIALWLGAEVCIVWSPPTVADEQTGGET